MGRPTHREDELSFEKAIAGFDPNEILKFEILKGQSEQIMERVNADIKSIQGVFFCSNQRLSATLLITHENGTVLHQAMSSSGSFNLENITDGLISFKFTNGFSYGREIITFALHINKPNAEIDPVESEKSLLSSIKSVTSTLQKLSGFVESIKLYNDMLHRQNISN
jgi:hypothetical protein